MLLDEMTPEELLVYSLNKEIALLKIENAELKTQLKKYRIATTREFETALKQCEPIKIITGLLLDESGQYRLKTLRTMVKEPV